MNPGEDGAVELVTDALSDATHHVTLRAADRGGAVCTATVAWWSTKCPRGGSTTAVDAGLNRV